MVDLITNSRKVKLGDTFIALRGISHDGHDYIPNAIENGAAKIICEEGNYNVETVIVSNTREYLENYLQDKYYPLIKDIKLVGVTGTNGKTTTCYLVYQMLKKLGKRVAYIGTIGFYMMDNVQILNNTTPDLIDLYNMFLECHNNNIEVIVMEVSSHSLEMGRVKGLEFDIAAFTNLTQDHLDYHKTFDNYALAKQKLFKKLRGERIAIVNKDDSYADKFIMEGNNNITLSANNGDALIKNMEFSNIETVFNFDYNKVSYNAKIEMVGRYNVYNYLTALIIVNKLGYPVNDILNLNNNLTPPPGRMELVKYHSNSIFIDYAHTPDAVINVLKSAHEYKKGQIITIVGCGGNRDRTKRPLMGKAATEMSDYVIFTNDNPRYEDEKVIMNDIIYNLKKNNYEVIYNRKEAIFKGMSLLKENDILLLLGKGHEDYQIIGGEKHHFNDKECVLEFMKK